jgi:hypothetical protein
MVGNGQDFGASTALFPYFFRNIHAKNHWTLTEFDWQAGMWMIMSNCFEVFSWVWWHVVWFA